MVNNYPKYAAGVNYKKTDSNNVTHFYSAQVVADPSDDTIESKLIEDGVVISEGGGGSSDFKKVNVTLKVNESRTAEFNLFFTNPETSDANGVYVYTDDNVRYISSDLNRIHLGGGDAEEKTLETYSYLNNPIYVLWLSAHTADDYTITGDAEIFTFTVQGETFYAVTIFGDCTISVVGSL